MRQFKFCMYDNSGMKVAHPAVKSTDASQKMRCWPSLQAVSLASDAPCEHVSMTKRQKGALIVALILPYCCSWIEI